MDLSDVFTAVAHKELVLVDLLGVGSNQHELNGGSDLKEFFGTEGTTRGKINWHYFADDEETRQEENEFTFYDARAKSADRTGRSEWRLYYYGDFLASANLGDLLVLVKTQVGQIHGLIFQATSAWRRAAHALFGLDQIDGNFSSVSKEALTSRPVELLSQEILNELNIGVTIPSLPTDEELMLKTFGRQFPKTKEMSQFARTQIEVDYRRPDEALARWLEREEQLFRALENVIIRERLVQNFASVDDFIQYSLSVQNRRKSRMGFALQNHLAELFLLHNLRFSAQACTEGKNKPDFIFPGEKEYHDSTFNSSLLVMLGVKSSSKDRWRQVLTEAERIPQKHLCTLEAGISTAQTNEMKRQQIALVIPSALHATYTAEQQSQLLSVADFVDFVRNNQTGGYKPSNDKRPT